METLPETPFRCALSQLARDAVVKHHRRGGLSTADMYCLQLRGPGTSVAGFWSGSASRLQTGNFSSARECGEESKVTNDLFKDTHSIHESPTIVTSPSLNYLCKALPNLWRFTIGFLWRQINSGLQHSAIMKPQTRAEITGAYYSSHL